MYRLFIAGLDAAVASVLIIPVFIFLNQIYFHNWKKTVFYMVFSVYLSGLYLVTGLPNVAYVRFEPNINLIPFLNMFSDFSAVLLNILLFLPLGFLSAIQWKSMRIYKYNLILGFSVSLSVEILQLFTFRATDVNDLITNTLGNLIGWSMSRVILRYFPQFSFNGTKKDTFVVFTAVFCIMFFIHPFIAPMIWELIY